MVTLRKISDLERTTLVASEPYFGNRRLQEIVLVTELSALSQVFPTLEVPSEAGKCVMRRIDAGGAQPVTSGCLAGR